MGDKITRGYFMMQPFTADLTVGNNLLNIMHLLIVQQNKLTYPIVLWLLTPLANLRISMAPHTPN